MYICICITYHRITVVKLTYYCQCTFVIVVKTPYQKKLSKYLLNKLNITTTTPMITQTTTHHQPFCIRWPTAV